MFHRASLALAGASLGVCLLVGRATADPPAGAPGGPSPYAPVGASRPIPQPAPPATHGHPNPAVLQERPAPPPPVVTDAHGHPAPHIANTEWDHCRAGYPQSIRKCAVRSDTGAYVGNYVGGGNPFCRKAQGPYLEDGTWGWDYTGRCFCRRVLLGWWHGRKYQGGVGRYETDGPHLRHLHEPEVPNGGHHGHPSHHEGHHGPTE